MRPILPGRDLRALSLYTSISGFSELNYGFERKFGKPILFFTVVVSIPSACGLIGLNLYVMNLRKKEIGIRKLLGAQIPELLISLIKRFAMLTLVGFVLSMPLSWYSLTKWLNSFAYKVNISPGLFIVAGVITAVLCVLSVALPSLRAATSNPVDALKKN
jgi:putative ABC transport system permease protein